MNHKCEHCFEENVSEKWNKATIKVFGNVVKIEELTFKNDFPFPVENNYLYVCPICRMTNQSQFIEKVEK